MAFSKSKIVFCFCKSSFSFISQRFSNFLTIYIFLRVLVLESASSKNLCVIPEPSFKPKPEPSFKPKPCDIELSEIGDTKESAGNEKFIQQLIEFFRYIITRDGDISSLKKEVR